MPWVRLTCRANRPVESTRTQSSGDVPRFEGGLPPRHVRTAMLDEKQKEALRLWYRQPKILDEARERIERKYWEDLEEFLHMRCADPVQPQGGAAGLRQERGRYVADPESRPAQQSGRLAGRHRDRLGGHRGGTRCQPRRSAPADRDPAEGQLGRLHEERRGAQETAGEPWFLNRASSMRLIVSLSCLVVLLSAPVAAARSLRLPTPSSSCPTSRTTTSTRRTRKTWWR